LDNLVVFLRLLGPWRLIWVWRLCKFCFSSIKNWGSYQVFKCTSNLHLKLIFLLWRMKRLLCARSYPTSRNDQRKLHQGVQEGYYSVLFW